MTYEELLDRGLIKRITPSYSQVKARLALAKRDIRAAKTMMPSDRDWAFSMAYNAVLQATRALMFSQGFRTTGGEGQHKTAVMFAENSLGEALQDDIYVFDKMRSKRHRVIYDVSGLVSQAEARQAYEFAVKFVREVEGLVKRGERREIGWKLLRAL
jgi:uncharacterized protein (UPF0332 family)